MDNEQYHYEREINRQGSENEMSAKEVTINYLESIRKDRLNAIELCKDDIESLEARVGLEVEVSYLNLAIKLVEESEGE